MGAGTTLVPTTCSSPLRRLAVSSSIAERAARGALLLSDGWRSRIDVDLLDAYSYTDSVLGQLYGNFTKGVAALGMKDDRSILPWDPVFRNWLVEHGFFCVWPDDMGGPLWGTTKPHGIKTRGLLTMAWVEEVRRVG